MKKILNVFFVAASLLVTCSTSFAERWHEGPLLPPVRIPGTIVPDDVGIHWHEAIGAPDEVDLIRTDCADLFKK